MSLSVAHAIFRQSIERISGLDKISDLHNWHASLSAKIRAEIDDLSTRRHFDAGKVVFAAGDMSDCGYHIISGHVKFCAYAKDGRELILGNLLSGDCIGEVGLITGEPRSNYAVACQDTDVNILMRKDFESLCLRYPQIPISINRVLCHRLRMMFASVEDASLLPLRERVARTIIYLTLSRGVACADGSIEIAGISQETLGQMHGSTRQSIGRELKKLESDNLVRLSYSKLIVLDIEAMRARFEQAVSHDPIVAVYPK
jgi:CRP/FNR family transcriptional regulator, cyclic AMP receptor protein